MKILQILMRKFRFTENNKESMIESTNTLKNLFQNIAIIQKKYDDIAKITGEDFNVFSVLKMDSKEVRMHSAFLGELLNPSGSHGLSDKPLEIFIKLFKEKFNIEDGINKFKIDSKSVNTVVEKHIGVTNDDKTEGGRIDIIIEDKVKNAIIIENKIYAREQENQLIRYNNYLKEAPILYLTLFGEAPTSQGELIENMHYFNVSYKEDIKDWLELCLKEAVNFPMLREVIKQYLYLVKKLTNQTKNDKMSDEIKNLIDEENVDLIFKINTELNNIINEMKSKLLSIKFSDIIIDNESRIKVVFEEDGGGVFIGYQYFKNNENRSSIHYQGEYFNFISEINKNKTFTTQSNFAWYHPVGFESGDRFINLGNKEIIKMYKNPTYFNEFIEKIITEEKEIRNQFEKLIS